MTSRAAPGARRSRPIASASAGTSRNVSSPGRYGNAAVPSTTASSTTSPVPKATVTAAATRRDEPVS